MKMQLIEGEPYWGLSQETKSPYSLSVFIVAGVKWILNEHLCNINDLRRAVKDKEASKGNNYFSLKL